MNVASSIGEHSASLWNTCSIANRLVTNVQAASNTYDRVLGPAVAVLNVRFSTLVLFNRLAILAFVFVR